MIEKARLYLKFGKHANFWDWVRASYSRKELGRLVEGATDCSLIRPWNPFSDTFIGKPGESLETLIHDLYAYFGREIWSACLGAGHYDPYKGPLGITCIASLDLSDQVHDNKTFEEFLVRNALKHAARQILEG